MSNQKEGLDALSTDELHSVAGCAEDAIRRIDGMCNNLYLTQCLSASLETSTPAKAAGVYQVTAVHRSIAISINKQLLRALQAIQRGDLDGSLYLLAKISASLSLVEASTDLLLREIAAGEKSTDHWLGVARHLKGRITNFCGELYAKALTEAATEGSLQ